MSSNTTLKGYTRIPEDYTGDIWIEGQIAALEAELQRCRQALEQSAVSSVETYIHEFAGLPHPGDFGIPKGHWWQAKAYADQLCTSTLKQEPVAWITEAVRGTDVALEKPDFGKAEWKAPTPKVTLLYTTPPQPEQNQFNPDWDAMAVMVKEQQRMAKRIEELEAATPQPTRQWVGLTTEQKIGIWEEYSRLTHSIIPTPEALFKVIETLLQEKNNENI